MHRGMFMISRGQSRVVLIFLLFVGIISTTAIQASMVERKAYLVQGGDITAVSSAVSQTGGLLTHNLPIIDAVGAELTPKQVAQLEKSPAITRVMEDVDVTVTSDLNTVRDEFASVDYNNQDGTVDWVGPWHEAGESNGPSSGYMMILSNQTLQFKYRNQSLWREADLTNADSL